MAEVKRYLIVDDDRSNNLICKCSIKRFTADAEILSFLEPEVALQFIRNSYDGEYEKLPTIIFLDINMPIISGWEFLKIFKTLPNKLQEQFSVFMLTSSIDIRDQQKAEEDPLIKGFLRKPLNTQMVSEIMTII